MYQKLLAVSDVLSCKYCDCISILKSMIFWLPFHMSPSVLFPKTASKSSICAFLLNILVILLAFKAKHKPLVVRTGSGVTSPWNMGLLIELFSLKVFFYRYEWLFDTDMICWLNSFIMLTSSIATVFHVKLAFITLSDNHLNFHTFHNLSHIHLSSMTKFISILQTDLLL